MPPRGICMEGRRAQPWHDGHIPPPLPPSPPPLGRGGSSALGEDGLLFLLMLGHPCPQALPCPCTPGSLPLPCPRVPAVLCPTPYPGTAVFLHLCVPVPRALFRDRDTSLRFGWWLLKDSTFSHRLSALVRRGRDKEMLPGGRGQAGWGSGTLWMLHPPSRSPHWDPRDAGLGVPEEGPGGPWSRGAI